MVSPVRSSCVVAEHRLGRAAVACGFLTSHRRLPLLVEPRDVALRDDPQRVLAWWAAHRAGVEALLQRHGALLLRGFAVPDATAFRHLTALHPQHAQGYVAGATPRAAVDGHVYESTRMAPSARIGLHQEMAYMPVSPRMLAFHCRVPPDRGGQTPLADMRAVTRRLAGPTLARFQARGVMYRRNFRRDPPGTGVGLYHRRLADAFPTDDPHRIEALCTERGLAWQWMGDGSLTLTHVGPATVRHPATGAVVWFNQASTLHLNARSVGPLALQQIRRACARGAAWPCEIRFGDGTPMDDSDLAPVYDALDAEETCFDWRQGDVLWLDNRLVAHGRRPYGGRREILVALLD